MLLNDQTKDWLHQNCILHPDKIFIIAKEKKLTFTSFNNIVNQYIAHFKSRIKLGDSVAILLDNSIEFIATIIALWRLEAVPIPINTRLTTDEVNSIINRNNIPFLICPPEYDPNDFKFCTKIKLPGTIDSNSETGYDNYIDWKNNAVVIFTSGSTTIPKGVIHTFKSLACNAAGVDAIVNHSDNDSWIGSLPFYHIGGFAIIARALLAGASLIIPESCSADGIIKSIREFKPSLISLVPTVAKQIVEKQIIAYPELKTTFVGGGPSNDKPISELDSLGWKPTKVYGSTETGSMVCALNTKDVHSKSSSSGKAILKNKIFIVDENGNENSPGNIGEIAIESKSLAKGYLNDPELTSKKFPGGKYFTGDYGYLDDEGFLYVESRREGLIISGGENINPAEVETAILTNDKIKEAIVFSIPDDKWGQIVAAAIVPIREFVITAKELKEFLHERIAPFKIPKRFFFIEDIPRNEMGKVQKSVLLKTLNLE